MLTSKTRRIFSLVSSLKGSQGAIPCKRENVNKKLDFELKENQKTYRIIYKYINVANLISNLGSCLLNLLLITDINDKPKSLGITLAADNLCRLTDEFLEKNTEVKLEWNLEL